MKTTTNILALGVLISMAQGTVLAATLPTTGSSRTAAERIPGMPSEDQAWATSSDNLESRPVGIASALKDLANRGIFLRANLIDQYARNTRGAAEQGHSNAGQFNLGADLNLDKLIGTTGSSFHFTVYKDYGYGLSHDVTGTFPKQQYIYKNEFPRWHLGTFAFEQKLLDDRLDIILGRLGTTSYYAKLTTNCQFQAGNTCGVPRLINSEAGYSLLPSATWGINARYRTTPNTYVSTGVYEVNPTTSASNGMDFSIAEANGVTVPLEWGWVERGNFEVKVGGYVSTAPRPDPYYNTAGRSLGLFGGTARTVNEKREGVYVLGDQVIWRPDSKSTRNLTAFGGVVQQLDDEEIMKQQFLAGLVLTGPTASRPRDTIGFSASLFNLTDKERDFLRDARAKAGGHGSNNPHEYSFELNYGWHLTPGVILMPNVQYIVHPDNSGLPKTATLPRNMLAYGLSVQLSFGGMFGLSAPSGGD